ncbi:MAG: hypothetical protein HOQ01_06110 [Lysobacter sp.]|nr:hypothetical protein [Lysobacter sp.]
MFKTRWASRALAATALFVLFSSSAYAQATRTWVSGVGDDVNPCSRTAPCKTFAGAISKTAAGGEISVLDPGGFGAVTITKSITITTQGSEGGVLVGGTNGIIINAAATDRVVLKGLTIHGVGTGLSGVRILSAQEVVVQDCLIEEFRGADSHGILVAPSAARVNVTVRNSTITGNGNGAGSGGITLRPSGTGNANLDADNVILANNSNGVLINGSAGGGASGSVRNSQIHGNYFDGIAAVSTTAAVSRVMVEDNALSFNGYKGGLTTSAGLRADGANASMRFMGNTITSNRMGVSFVNGGQLYSYGGNVITTNSNNGAFTSTQATQ